MSVRGFKRNRRRVDVILLEDHPKLGYKGQVASVKPGYGRNYLIPKGLAAYAIKENREKYITHEDEEVSGVDERELELRVYFDDLRRRLQKITLYFERAPSWKTKLEDGTAVPAGVTAHQIINKLWNQHQLYQLEEEHIIMPPELAEMKHGLHVATVDMRQNVLPTGIPVAPDLEPFELKVSLSPPAQKKQPNL